MAIIKIYSKEKTSGKGIRFLAHRAQKKDGTYYTIRFRNNCNVKPSSQGYWLIDVKGNNCNWAKNSYTNKQGELKEEQILWVSVVDMLETAPFEAADLTGL